MTNPYKTQRMKHFRHKLRPLYYLCLPLLLPKWLLWRCDQFLEKHAIGARVGELFNKLTQPLRALWAFVNAWAESRNWKKLLIASPVVIGIFVGFTVYYINANKNRGQALDGYYAGALEAMNEGDYKQADFLFPKLINHPSYQDDDQMNFQAMLAAKANSNTTRFEALKSRLLGERDYEPAKRWLAENAIKRGRLPRDEVIELITMARTMVESSQQVNDDGYWTKILAQLLLSMKDATGAISVLTEEEELKPEAWLLLAEAYQTAGDIEKAKRELRALVADLDKKDPNNEKYLREKVESLATLAGLGLDLAENKALLERALAAVQLKRQLAVDQGLYNNWSGVIRMRLFSLLLRMSDSELRIEAFEHLEKVIQAKNPAYGVGGSLNGVVDSSSGYSLLTGQIREVLVRSGGSAPHLAMALDAWKGGNAKKAQMHLKLAHAIHPNASVAARYAATSSAGSSDPNKLDLNLFRGDNRSTYQRSLDLLKLVAEVDPEQSVAIAFDRCYLYSQRKNWNEIIDVIEPNLANFEGKELVQAYDWLARANTKLGQEDRAEEFQHARQQAARKLRE